MIADELRRQADTFLDLNELAPYIAREHRAAVAIDDEEEEEDDEATSGNARPRRSYQNA